MEHGLLEHTISWDVGVGKHLMAENLGQLNPDHLLNAYHGVNIVWTCVPQTSLSYFELHLIYDICRYSVCGAYSLVVNEKKKRDSCSVSQLMLIVQ